MVAIFTIVFTPETFLGFLTRKQIIYLFSVAGGD